MTYGTVNYAACLTPEGTLQLRDTERGPVETLTPADIAWIHAHGG